MTDNTVPTEKLQDIFEKTFRGRRLHALPKKGGTRTWNMPKGSPTWLEASRPWQAKNPDCGFYFSPVRFKPKSATSKKPDVLSSSWLWLDLDPRDDQPLGAERATMLELLTWGLPDNVPAPTFVIDSGRGYWGLWHLKTAHVVDGPSGDKTRALEAALRGLATAFGEYGDRSVINSNRIVRLPGTINLKTKRRAEVVEFNSVEYTLADFPSIVVERKPRADGTGDPLPIDLVEQMLAATPYTGGPDGLDDRRTELGWRNFMMAVHEASGGDPVAGDFFIKWSQDDPEYTGDNTAETIEPRWESLDSGTAGGITRGSWVKVLTFFGNDELVAEAMGTDAEEDFSGDPPEPGPEPKISAEKLAEQRKQRKADADAVKAAKAADPDDPNAGKKKAWDNQCAVIVKPPAFVDVKRRYLLNNKSFDHRFGYIGGDDAHRKAIKSKMIKRYHGIGFKPIDARSFKVDGQTVFNMYRPQKIEAWDGDDKPTIILEHLKYLIPDLASRQHFANWLAWIVQNPDKKLMHAVLLVGNKRTGKSFFGELMKVILGAHNCSEPSRKRVASEFNGWLANRLLVIIHELREKGARGLYDELKEYITQGKTSINQKGIEAFEVDNFSAFLTITNHDNAIPIDDQEGRYLVIRCADRPQFGKGTPASATYYDRLFRCIGTPDEPSAEARKFLRWLRARDISKYNGQGTAPETRAKDEMVVASLDGVQRFVRDMVELKQWPLGASIINTSDVLAELPSSIPQVLRGEGHVEACLREIGARPLTAFGVMYTKTGRKRLWALDGSTVGQICQDMTRKQVAAIYDAAVAERRRVNTEADTEEARTEMAAR